MSSRETFLARVRQAVKDGNRTGAAAPLPERGPIGYQGGGADPLKTFVAMCQAMGARPTVVTSRAELLEKIAVVLEMKKAKKVLVGRGPVMARLAIEPWVRSTGRDAFAPDAPKETLFAVDISVTGVTSLIAETGSLVVAVNPEMTRSESLLPPVHIAVALREQIVPDLFDVFDAYSAAKPPPSNLVFITGPSKTGDIELKLVTGVHGPGEVHVLILDAPQALG
jgi:L-lactate dehydrogenase complex protein LldG